MLHFELSLAAKRDFESIRLCHDEKVNNCFVAYSVKLSAMFDITDIPSVFDSKP